MGPHDLVADEEREKVLATAVSQRIPRSVTGVHQTKAGKRMDVEILSDELTYQGRAAWISIIRDITELKKEEMRLSRLANFDSLTGLANPLLFDDRIRQAMARSERSGDSLALLYIDLDHFKDVNDRFGHAAGNDLLRQVAARLGGSVRKVDTVARLGGDEFTVILEGIRQPQDAAGVARKVLDRMRAPFTVDGRDVTVTTSIGLALFPQDAQSADGLLRCADIALYHAKGKGRDAVASFSPGMGNQGRRPSSPTG
jgi:diguanylate cyclase (GGDEF)-like protein